MKKFLFYTVLLLILFGIFSLSDTANAGGGQIYLDARAQNTTWKQRRAYVVRIYLSPSIKCLDVPITFKFEEPQDGDSVSTPDGSYKATIRQTSSRFVNNRLINDCTTYAKVFSSSKTNRNFYAEVFMPDGTTYTSSKIILDFQTDNPIENNNPTSTPWDNDTDQPKKTTISLFPTVGIQEGKATNPTIAPSQVIPTDDKKVDELNKKVKELENKVAEANKKQSILEKQVNSLISFIKKLLPFWK